MARISIISPCFNQEDNVEACHASVAKLFALPRDAPPFARLR